MVSKVTVSPLIVNRVPVTQVAGAIVKVVAVSPMIKFERGQASWTTSPAAKVMVPLVSSGRKKASVTVPFGFSTSGCGSPKSPLMDMEQAME